ncbi:uncharacterized protein [Pyrus communis]|uniref:uncharacterized protein n=1 Tax=Pyrus communis TaxID=23211 RepID=UPI0035C03C11
MDQTKYCAFHKGPGYTTNDFITWRRYLEQLMKEGKCDQYVNRSAARLRQEAVPMPNPQPRQSVTESLPNPSIWRPPVTPRRGRSSRQDRSIRTLVISVQLAHAIVDRVMVDNSSSVNLLQLSVIWKMGLENMIQRKTEVLTGFNELTLIAIGTITLDVTNPPIVSS